ncbi:hypothetical protein [Runella sp.]
MSFRPIARNVDSQHLYKIDFQHFKIERRLRLVEKTQARQWGQVE